jgi:putative addiction module component (TIGR02574 family)
MSPTLLKREALKLPKAQRIKLASILFNSVPVMDEEPLTIAELDRRADEARSGKVKMISAAEFKAHTKRLMSKLKRNRQAR